MSRNWIYWRIVHIIVDTIGIFCCFLIGYRLRIGSFVSSDFPLTPFLYVALLGTFTWITFLLFTKYYRIPPRSGGRSVYDITLILGGGVLAVGVLIITYFFQRELFFSRLMNIYILLLGFILLLGSRFIFLSLIHWFKVNTIGIYRTLIIGANPVAQTIITNIQCDPYAPYMIDSVIDPYGLKKEVKLPHITKKDSSILKVMKINQLESICHDKKITAIIQCDAFEHTINIISFCEERDIKYQFAPSLRGIFEKNLTTREVAGMTMISYIKRNFSNKKKRITYRGIDFILKQVFDIE